MAMRWSPVYRFLQAWHIGETDSRTAFMEMAAFTEIAPFTQMADSTDWRSPA
jgi:hypothetical protein